MSPPEPTAARPVPPTLEDLVERFRGSGDLDALGHVFDRAAPGLFRIALACCPDAATAEDVLQETFLTAFRNIDRFERGRPITPWLGGILRNQAAKARDRAGRTKKDFRKPPPLAPADPAQSAADADDLRQLHEAILKLSEPYRGVALMRWRYGLEPAEIAEVRGEPPGTVRSTLSRALAQLRKTLAVAPALLLAAEAAGMSAAEALGMDAVRTAVLDGCRATAIQFAAAASLREATTALTSAPPATSSGYAVIAKVAGGLLIAAILLVGIGVLLEPGVPMVTPPRDSTLR